VVLDMTSGEFVLLVDKNNIVDRRSVKLGISEI
jgi:hypothetical protein